MSVDEKYKTFSTKEHVLNKDMWAGTSKSIECAGWFQQNDRLDFTTLKYPPSLYKAVDEAVVNALDHCINQYNKEKKVTKIKISLTNEGEITIENNGDGIEIEMHKASGKYVPELIFGTMYSGSNMDKSGGSITGGTNGVGIKLANILSKWFKVEIVRNCAAYSKKYVQLWENNMDKCCAPKITMMGESARDYTRISFMPDYEHFKFRNMETLNILLKTRATMAAAYINGSGCIIYFNGAPIKCKGSNGLANMIMADADIFSTTIGGKFKWDISIIVAENNSSSKSNFSQLSIVNGIIVKSGKHTEYILSEITENIKMRITKILNNKKIKFKPELIYSNIVICACCKIPNIGWTGQTKENLVMKTPRGFLSEYKFSSSFINKLTESIGGRIIDSIVTTKSPKKKIVFDKYYPANYAGGPKSLDCSLFLPEGDSAKGWCVKGITHIKNGWPLLGFDKYGILTTGGVTINVRKQMKKVATGIFSPNEKLALNKFWNAFLGVTGLDPNCKYEDGPKGLRYGCVIGFVDQDHDGVGFIFSLILNMFELLWPRLLQRGYVKRFVTPLRRAYPCNGGHVEEFYSDFEFDKWASEKNVNEYKIKYIKGLATHSEREIIHMFENFKANLYTYFMNNIKLSHKAFELYFGEDADARKKEFRERPIETANAALLEWQNKNLKIDCEDHLSIEAKAHDISNLYQKLWSAIDGMNESGRKILDGSQKKFAKSDAPIKVAQLAGFISEHENYHHGQASLESSITGKAFIAVGGIQLPQLQPFGNFGTRAQGGKDAGQPRYIETRLNKSLTNLLYPPQDKPLLKYTFDEGIRGEPEFYVPIVPMAILESTQIPAHGWKMEVWARDAIDIIDYVEAKISKGPLPEVKFYMHNWTGKISAGYSKGTFEYSISNAKIKITELPLRTWTDDFFKKIMPDEKGSGGKSIIEPGDSKNHSGDTIDITLKLTGDYAAVLKKTPPEIYFGLRDHMIEHLNFMGANREVVEFSSFEEVINYWFPFRRDMYGARINREIIILELKIKYNKNIKRYIEQYEQIGIKGKNRALANEILAKSKFDRFNKQKLSSCGFIKTDLLVSEIMGSSGTYNYLLCTTDMKRLKEAIIAREEKLKKLINELQQLQKLLDDEPFPGASLWREELKKLRGIILEGRNSKWMFGEEKKYNY